MRIVVLAYNLIDSGGLSVGRNVTALLPRLREQHEYLMLVPAGLGYEQHTGDPHVTVREIPRRGLLGRVLFDLLTLPKMVKDFSADLVLALGNVGLSDCPCKQAILIHQPQMVYSSEHYGRPILKDRFRLWGVRRRIKACLGSTQVVFCQTPVMRHRFAESFEYPIEHIKLMPNAVSEFAKQAENPSVPPILAQKNGTFYLFFLAYYMPHKNFEVLIELFRHFREQLKDVRCIITIAREQNKKASILLDNIQKYHLENQIVNVGRLKQEELAGYFYHSDAMFFPTLLESFSGTYLEAMHFGQPILTSDLDFAWYVCDDAAVYFDPWNPKDIVEKILLLKNSESMRKELVQKGRQRISKFFRSWEQIVSDMLREIENL